MRSLASARRRYNLFNATKAATSFHRLRMEVVDLSVDGFVIASRRWARRTGRALAPPCRRSRSRSQPPGRRSRGSLPGRPGQPAPCAPSSTGHPAAPSGSGSRGPGRLPRHRRTCRRPSRRTPVPRTAALARGRGHQGLPPVHEQHTWPGRGWRLMTGKKSYSAGEEFSVGDPAHDHRKGRHRAERALRHLDRQGSHDGPPAQGRLTCPQPAPLRRRLAKSPCRGDPRPRDAGKADSQPAHAARLAWITPAPQLISMRRITRLG